MSDFGDIPNVPKTGLTDPTPSQDPISFGSNRDSLNLDDFEKVEADQLPPPVSQSGGATSDFMDNIMAQVSDSGKDLFSNFSSGLTSDTKPEVSPVRSDFTSDPFKRDAERFDPFSSEASSDMFMGKSDSVPADSLDLFASAPPPPATDFRDETPPVKGEENLNVFMTEPPSQKPISKPLEPFSAYESLAGLASRGVEDLLEPMTAITTQAALRDPSPDSMFQREPSPPPRQPTPLREPTPPPREPTPPPRQPTPPREPSLPPRQPTPLREPSPPPRQPTPPREPTPPLRQPTPPREPTPVSEPTPPREPTPVRKPTPPREPTPVREPTPPPRQPTPSPRQPTPPREATPPLEYTRPPREPTPPTPVFVPTPKKAPVQEACVTQGTSYQISAATKASFAVFNPRAWFNPQQLDPRVVDLIYWRNVKKTGVVFGGVMVVLLSLAYLSLISVVSYTSLALLSGTITFRVYKNIMQAVQKSQDGHPFKDILELDTNLPEDKVHEATDIIVKQINSTVSELKRLFLVEDLVDSVKFGCLLWCLTYLGALFNGLTLVILGVVALFSLPKVYEQNQAQIDQYVGLVRTQVNDVMSKVKAALPIGSKEKAQ